MGLVRERQIVVGLCLVGLSVLACAGSEARLGGGGGAGGVASGGTGGSVSVGGSPFGPLPVCTGAFCWETPPAVTVRDIHVASDSSLWLATDGALGRRRDGAWEFTAANDLIAVWAQALDDGWGLRSNGTLVHWDGQSLSDVPVPAGVKLRDVWGFGTEHMWVAGNAGALWHFDRTSWTAIPGAMDDLYAIWGSSAEDVYVVGGALNPYEVGHFNGALWEFTQSSFAVFGLRAVAGGPDGSVFAATRDGVVRRLLPSPAGWVAAPLQDFVLTGIAVTDDGAVWASGDEGLYRAEGAILTKRVATGGNALQFDPVAGRLLLGGDGLLSVEPSATTSEWELAREPLRDLWVNAQGAGLGFDSDGALVRYDSGTLTAAPQTPPMPSGNPQEYLFGLADGTAIYARRYSSLVDVLVLVGAGFTALPQATMSDSQLVIVGSGSSDLWILSQGGASHFDGSTWQTGPAPGFDLFDAVALPNGDIWGVGGVWDDQQQANVATVGLLSNGDWTVSSLGETDTFATAAAQFKGSLYVSAQKADGSFRLFRSAGGAWSAVEVPVTGAGVSNGVRRGGLTATAGELFAIVPSAGSDGGRLAAFDGTSWRLLSYPSPRWARLFSAGTGLRLFTGIDALGGVILLDES